MCPTLSAGWLGAARLRADNSLPPRCRVRAPMCPYVHDASGLYVHCFPFCRPARRSATACQEIQSRLSELRASWPRTSRQGTRWSPRWQSWRRQWRWCVCASRACLAPPTLRRVFRPAGKPSRRARGHMQCPAPWRHSRLVTSQTPGVRVFGLAGLQQRLRRVTAQL